MTLIIANRAVMSRQGLSEGARIALAFVDGGLEWVDWAGESMARYDFSDESSLIGAIQEGLHGNRYALLPNLGLMVSPVKLMTMDTTDLRTLVRAEGTDGNDPALAAQVQILLSRHRLVTQQGLAGVQALLGKLGVAGNPLFQAMSLEDQLTLYGVLDFPDAGSGSPLNGTAALFAVQQARTAAEFADYYTAFLGYVNRRNGLDSTPEQQTQMAAGAMQTLLPLLFPMLDCPTVGGLVAPDMVAAAVQSWLRQGRMMGFGRLSEAVACFMLYSSYAGGDTAQARQTITDYMTSWAAFLSEHPPRHGLMGQDGASCLFPIEANGLRGELVLGPDGAITTRLFRRVPAPQPLAPPAPGP